MAFPGEQIGKLGFGLMRLPMDGGQVDLRQFQQMVDLFLEKGFNYFDTAYGYLDGKSEAAAREAIVKRYPRDRYLLATKLPAWSGAPDQAAAEQMFWTSLKRTGAEYFDFYLMHNMGGDRSVFFERYHTWEFLLERKREGLIRHLGFSFHDKADELERLLQMYPETEFVQLQINYADWENPAIESRLCYEMAQRYGKPVVIMEPVRGGSLAKLPPEAEKLFRAADPKASASSWALRYAASLEGLVTVLSGMSTLEQMQDNVSVMASFRPLDQDERQVVAQVREILAKMPQVPCTACRYCVKGCPQSIEIPGIFRAMNSDLIYGNRVAALSQYAFETRHGGVASRCIGCGQCESVCPQHIGIIALLAQAAKTLEKRES